MSLTPCDRCGAVFRHDTVNNRLVCNCAKRPNGHELYPRCHLEPGSRWAECLCAQIDPQDRPCVTCDTILDSAKTCAKCEEEAQRHAINLAAHIVGAA